MKLSNLTVVVTHYNTPEHLLDRAIRSILEHELQYIIVNDCSDPEFSHFLDKYGDRVLNLTKRTGQSGAMYAGMFAVKSPYVMRFDSDDILIDLPGEYSGVDVTMQESKYDIPINAEQLSRRPYAYLGGAIFKVSTTMKLWSDNKEILHEDIEFMYRMFNKKLKVSHLPKVWYKYTSDRKDSKTKTATLQKKKEVQQRLKEEHLVRKQQ
jgi:glycosyltransferase involved in cell wall biosynthesis